MVAHQLDRATHPRLGSGSVHPVTNEEQILAELRKLNTAMQPLTRAADLLLYAVAIGLVLGAITAAWLIFG